MFSKIKEAKNVRGLGLEGGGREGGRRGRRGRITRRRRKKDYDVSKQKKLKIKTEGMMERKKDIL